MLASKLCLKTCPDKTESIRFSKNEILLLLRSYIAHPGDYDSIVGKIKENLYHMQPCMVVLALKWFQKDKAKATGKIPSHNCKPPKRNRVWYKVKLYVILYYIYCDRLNAICFKITKNDKHKFCCSKLQCFALYVLINETGWHLSVKW